ncbi:MAG: conjugal transfer protein TraF [Sutterellaceae bacterium]|nr:conjugal transfer protein TraF [Sutterellaceae bacterium]
MHSLFKKAIIASLLVTVCHAAYAVTATEAAQNQPSNIFYNSGAEGWYWYVDPVPEEELEPIEPPPEAPKPPEPTKEAKAGPAPFSLKWVQEMLPKYKEIAWDNPTPENVQAYFLVQRFAMDRATKFADVAQQVVIGNVMLDESMRRPLATFAGTYIDRASARHTDDMLRKIAEKAGIFFFFKSSCRYCEAQAPLLAYFEDYGFDILAVSMDGGELKSHKFANTKLDSGQAEALGVTATPAIYLMNEEGQFTSIGQTVMSYDDLRRRILLVAQREGWITEEEFKDSQPYLNPNDQHDLSKELPKLLQASVGDPTVLFSSEEQSEKVIAMSDTDKAQLTNKDNFIEPSKLVALFGKAAQTSGNIEDGDLDENQEN